jgi:hypothetical protein
LTGFATGDGSFSVGIKKKSKVNTGFQVYLGFTLTQHSRDEQLMKSLIDYLNWGIIVIP